jgi:hypothetical protein
MKTSHSLAAIGLMVSCATIAAPKLANKPAAPSGMPRYGMAVYSDLCIHQDSGEFGGQRVTVQRFAEVDTVIYEYTAGGLSWPIVADDVQIGPHGDKLIFTLQVEGEEKTLSGTFADNGDTFVLDGGYCGQPDVSARLRKVTDFGRNPAPCKPCPARKAAPRAPESPKEPAAPAVPHESPVRPAARETQSA